MKKRLLSLILASCLCFSFTSCGSKTKSEPENEKNEESAEDSYQYNISALLSEDNTYNQILLSGFRDCLSDYLGEDHFTITTSCVTDDANSDQITSSAIKSSPDMIFTAGKATLTSAASSTETIPIVATGIVDFKGTLRIASLNGKAWDNTTGKNITGVSSKPSIVDQVSLMIEATKDLQTVGILFSPEDTDTIYQNEIFEAYLNQAGIPWKEYLIPATDTDVDINNEEEQNSTALTPSKFVAFSAKEGMDNDVLDIGENLNLGLNSPSSTRVALVSDFWTGGKVLPKEETTEEDADDSDASDKKSETDKKADSDKKSDSKDSDKSDEVTDTIEDKIKEACNECSAIYIPFGSMLTDQMPTIGQIAEDENVVLIGGDTDIAEYTLVTLFSDPYDLGYSAGKKAIKVFDGEDIGTIKIGSGDSDDAVKLYNGEIAAKFDLQFPKSFKEFTEFLSTYQYGSNTVRYSITAE